MAYNCNPVTIEIHHGGSFVWKPNIKYLEGEVKCVSDCDRKKLSILYFQELYHIVLGKSGLCLMYYRLPGVSLDNGLCALKTDIDVDAMVDVYDGLTVICIYIVKEGEVDHRHVETRADVDGDFHKQFEEEVEGICDKIVTSEEEELEDDEHRPPSVHSNVPSYDEGLEMPNDDIFELVVQSGGPDLFVDDWFSDTEDPLQAEDLRNLSDSEDGEMRQGIGNTDEFNEATGMKNPTLFVGLKFSTP